MGTKDESDAERNEVRVKGGWTGGGRDIETHSFPGTDEEIGREIKYEKRSII